MTSRSSFDGVCPCCDLWFCTDERCRKTLAARKRKRRSLRKRKERADILAILNKLTESLRQRRYYRLNRERKLERAKVRYRAKQAERL